MTKLTPKTKSSIESATKFKRTVRRSPLKNPMMELNTRHSQSTTKRSSTLKKTVYWLVALPKKNSMPSSIAGWVAKSKRFARWRRIENSSPSWIVAKVTKTFRQKRDSSLTRLESPKVPREVTSRRLRAWTFFLSLDLMDCLVPEEVCCSQKKTLNQWCTHTFCSPILVLEFSKWWRWNRPCTSPSLGFHRMLSTTEQRVGISNSYWLSLLRSLRTFSRLDPLTNGSKRTLTKQWGSMSKLTSSKPSRDALRLHNGMKSRFD